MPRPEQARCLHWCGGVAKTMLWCMRHISNRQDVGGCFAQDRASGVNHTIEEYSTLKFRGVGCEYYVNWDDTVLYKEALQTSTSGIS